MDILICDDEQLAVARLTRLVTQLGHQVVATVNHGLQVIESVKKIKPDVVLLDIQMPEMDGLACAQMLSQMQPMPAIIFCTAYSEHALEAIQARANGYLLKPIELQELKTALDQVTELNQAQMTTLEKEQIMEEKVQRQQIVAKTYRGVELIPIENIYYFLADQKYVTVRHKNGSVLIDETLKDLESELGERFVRIHRNALVAQEYIDGLEMVSSGQYQVRIREIPEKLSVSRRHLAALREKMQNL
ncbi:LytTR family DNA-binding domain-containing protein [Acinetobacter gerneri]|uniref:LytR/AlgR family response regulator transcription factor n=1 Tax=Acinetobacter gerneri TaxID=202952 RepID=UPI00293637D7|nr:LytTR family DNA-binding domain-containing protein [Acinetobacter gerneri]MDV2438537.1 LytTR family DNA-binding domain-containing protein [Acinetobacter gerneri]